ncbi:DUF4365 domain-containing protein [Micromonospora parva]|uniref:DUF4365 domain-containing protein n=1 Tax=Micromonospora parva TaxID=1464048 RepID=UPI0033F97FFF
MEQLQVGYVASIAATAGCFVTPITWDNWGFDVWIVRPPKYMGGQEVSIYAQLKNTTTIRPDPERGQFSYQFKKRSYLEALTLRSPNGIPGVVLIMATSPEQQGWTAASHDSLVTKHCCYWASFEGRAITEGVERPSVPIPTANIFDAAALHSIMDRIERGEELA